MKPKLRFLGERTEGIWYYVLSLEGLRGYWAVNVPKEHGQKAAIQKANVHLKYALGLDTRIETVEGQ